MSLCINDRIEPLYSHGKSAAAATQVAFQQPARAIKQLERRGYISRIVNKQDNRASYMALTHEGRVIYEHIAPEALSWETGFLASLDVSEYRGFMAVLDKLEAQMETMNENT